MIRTMKNFSVLVLISVLFIMIASSFAVSGAPGNGSRFTGSVSVPDWKAGDKWGYKSSSYGSILGVGFEVVGTETVNGNECYNVKVWWDSSYASDEEYYNQNTETSGFSYTYLYEGHAYFTKDKLAIAKFTNELQMRTKFDGSELLAGTGTRSMDYSSYLENMKNWKYDISYSFKITYDYNPPFIMYDYPLEVGKKWDSESEVTVTWEYFTHIYMNDAMKSDIEELYGGEYTGFGDTEEEGSDTSKFKLMGSFEVINEDSITTETGPHSIFTINYDISLDYTSQSRSTSTPPTSYGSLAVPGGDATLNLVGGTSGSGTSYFDPEAGYSQKLDQGGYLSESYSTIDPSSIDNSYNNLSKSSSFSSDSNDDTGLNILLILAAGIGIVVFVVIIIVVVLIKKMNKEQTPPYPPGYNNQPYPPEQLQQPPQPPPLARPHPHQPPYPPQPSKQPPYPPQ